jgi:precorrin-6x reductase
LRNLIYLLINPSHPYLYRESLVPVSRHDKLSIISLERERKRMAADDLTQVSNSSTTKSTFFCVLLWP